MKHSIAFSAIVLICMVSCRSTRVLEGNVGIPVDLGLSVKWADRNYGAWTVKGEGIGLTWSDTTVVGKKTKREKRIEHPWGRRWKTPTGEQVEELMEKCVWKWQDEIPKGYIVTGPNGNSIFMPMVTGGYWTLALDKIHKPYISYMYFNSSYPAMSYGETNVLKHIRPVTR